MAEIEPWSREAAELYDLTHRSNDYGALAERVHGFIQHHSPGATSLVDVACGTGRYLEELRRWYEVEGVDLSPGMLELARRGFRTCGFTRPTCASSTSAGRSMP